MQLSSAICLDLELGFLGNEKCEPTYTEISIIDRTFQVHRQQSGMCLYAMLQTWKSRSECTVLAFILKHSLPLCLSVCFLAVTKGIPRASRAVSSLHIWEKPLQQFGNCKTVYYKNIKLTTLIVIRDATEGRAMNLLRDNHSHICWCQSGLKGVSRVT